MRPLLRLAIAGSVLLALSSCTRSAKVASPCASGKDPLKLSGECKGAWSFVPGKDGANSRCDFNWGPKVSCPEKTKSLGYESVCYGTTQKPLDGNMAVAPEECGKRFGGTPLDPHYELLCCPE